MNSKQKINMIDWVSIVRQSNRRFPHFVYGFVPRVRRRPQHHHHQAAGKNKAAALHYHHNNDDELGCDEHYHEAALDHRSHHFTCCFTAVS